MSRYFKTNNTRNTDNTSKVKLCFQVEYDERNKAKETGLRWDPKLKTWCIEIDDINGMDSVRVGDFPLHSIHNWTEGDEDMMKDLVSQYNDTRNLSWSVEKLHQVKKWNKASVLSLPVYSDKLKQLAERHKLTITGVVANLDMYENRPCVHLRMECEQENGDQKNFNIYSSKVMESKKVERYTSAGLLSWYPMKDATMLTDDDIATMMSFRKVVARAILETIPK